jgi:transcriptional regulator with XRE-family HTH domain
VTTPIGPRGWIVDEAGELTLAASAPGVIGGAIIRAARRSADLSRQDLARMLTADPSTIRDCENGIRPLFCVSYHQLCQLSEALYQAGARVGHDKDELLLASQCDLLIAGILRGFEDYAELPPIDEDVAGEAARSLLRWALTGQVPGRYRPYAPAGLLLTGPDASLFADVARDLQAGSHGDDLASYGTALAALTTLRIPGAAQGDTGTDR